MRVILLAVALAVALMAGGASAQTPPGRGAQYVFRPDTRAVVPNTTIAPWRAVAYLGAIDGRSGEEHGCTGAFIGPNAVLTAAHCLYSREAFGGYASRVIVVPGQNGYGDAPFGVQYAAAALVPGGWMDTESGSVETPASAPYDFGLVVMPDSSLGSHVGWFTVGSLADATLADPTLSFVIAGYDKDAVPTDAMIARMGSGLAAWSPTRLEYTVSTIGGTSGAPVWRRADRLLFGVNQAGSDVVARPNSGRRVGADVLAFLASGCDLLGCSFSYYVEPAPTPPTGTPAVSPTPSPTHTATPQPPRGRPRVFVPAVAR